MQSALGISDYFILLFVASVFIFGAYTVFKFMRKKD